MTSSYDSPAGTIQDSSSEDPQYIGGIEIVETEEQADNLLRRLKGLSGPFGFDTETEGVHPGKESPVGKGSVVCWSLSWFDSSLGTHPTRGTPLARRAFLWGDLLPQFKGFLEDSNVYKVGHSIWAFDKHILQNAGVNLRGIQLDTLRLARLLNAGSDAGLKPLMERLFGYKLGTIRELFSRRVNLGTEPESEIKYTKRTICGLKVPTLIGGAHTRVGAGTELTSLGTLRKEYPEKLADLRDYASLDAKGTLELGGVLRQSARRAPWVSLGGTRYGTMLDYYERVWNPFLGVLYDIERAGIRYDPSRTAVARETCRARCGELLSELRTAHGEAEFNPGSPPQLTDWLYNRLEYPVPPVFGTGTALKKTPPGKKPTTAASLDWLTANGYGKQELGVLKAWKKETRLLEFLDKLPNHVGPNGRIHTVLQPEAATGRLTSKNPNLQQIPKLDSYGIRKGFVPAPGNVFIISDYSQLELYVLAHFLVTLFGDTSFAETLASGDAHAATASKLGMSRSAAKAINFAINYGKSAMGLSLSLGITEAEAQRMLNAHADGYPGIKRFQEYNFSEAQRTGVVRTLAGRTRPLLEAKSENRRERAAAFRKACNTPIQGSAADVVISAMLKLRNELPPEARMVCQIHDEIIVECPRVSSEHALSDVVRCMENPFKTNLLCVPLRVDASIRESWGD